MRRYTTLLILTDEKLPVWLMDAHLGKEPVNGIRVVTITSGNQMGLVEKLLSHLDDIRDDLPEDVRTLMDTIIT